MPQSIRGILLDIEGTTSSISFVYDVMFPYVRENLTTFLVDNWSEESVQRCLPLLAVDFEHAGLNSWLPDSLSPEKARIRVGEGVLSLMDCDVKATGLKQLQGAIWKDGFHSGQMVAHLYDDVAPAIKTWNDAGVDVRIYSSGSIAAQKLFFGHSVAGDLLPLLNGHYDTTTGPKQVADSYRAIASEFDCVPGEILFLSDVAAELDAARESGMQIALSLRPGNKPVENPERFECIESFSVVQVGE